MNTEHERELPMLAGIAALIAWCEELLNIVNGPLLLLGAGIALVDLLTDGALTLTAPILLYAWAISQAAGIDAQLLGAFARARSAQGWTRAGWLLLGGILGYAAWQAGDVFAVQQAQHITEAAALAQLGMPVALWLGWRAFLAVGLVALSGWTRYRKPAKVTLSLDEERATLERELMLAPMRQQLLAQRVGGIRALAQTALQGQQTPATTLGGIERGAALFAQESHHTAAQEAQQTAQASGSDGSPTPPAGPGSPSLGSNPRRSTSKGAAANVTRLPAPRAPRQSRRTAAQANARSGKRGTAEARIRALLAQDPAIEFDELVTRAGVSRSTASKYVALVAAERDRASTAQQEQGGQYAQ